VFLVEESRFEIYNVKNKAERRWLSGVLETIADENE